MTYTPFQLRKKVQEQAFALLLNLYNMRAVSACSKAVKTTQSGLLPALKRTSAEVFRYFRRLEGCSYRKRISFVR